MYEGGSMVYANLDDISRDNDFSRGNAFNLAANLNWAIAMTDLKCYIGEYDIYNYSSLVHWYYGGDWDE